MKQVTSVTSALRRVGLQGLLLAGLIVASVPAHAATGTDHGFFWQNYVSSGTSNISFPSAGTYPGNFAVSYTNVGDVVAGKGWNPGSSTRTIGYNIGALSGSYNFVGVYGWTTSPLIEYYVCELGSITYAATNVGSVSSDGHSYGLYKHQQVNQPSIIGTAHVLAVHEPMGRIVDRIEPLDHDRESHERLEKQNGRHGSQQPPDLRDRGLQQQERLHQRHGLVTTVQPGSSSFHHRAPPGM
ncbi:MAG: glycoside hydrolase family 11 protein [Lacunisphaera sp.]